MVAGGKAVGERGAADRRRRTSAGYETELGMAKRTKTDAGRFWGWLGENTARVKRGLKRGTGRVVEEVGERFDEAFPGLVWEVSPADRGPWLFCVSANGDGKLFPRVERVVREAPEVAGWTIQAFRPRGEAGAEITLNDVTLGGGDVWCEVRKARRGIDLVLHVRGATAENHEMITQAALILLDNAIGEYDTVKRIAELDVAMLEGRPRKSEGFFPLKELPGFLDGARDGRGGGG